MDNYIKQLIDDIRSAASYIQAQNEIRGNAVFDDAIAEGDFSDVEKFIYGEEIPISDIMGIDADLLPPENKLTRNQQALLAEELEMLLGLKNFILEFPEKLPTHRRYPLIRKFWSEKHVETSFGTSHIEFCRYEPEKCPYPDYCMCKEFEQSDNNPDLTNDEDPDQDHLNELPF